MSDAEFIELPGGQRLECVRVPACRAGPTLVLLHEGLGCVALWKDFPERLAAATGLAVFAWSRAGYGASSPIALPRPRDFHTIEALTVLGPLLDAAGTGECVLIGHSDGASIALVYAGHVHDPRVRGVVVMAPHVLTEAKTRAAIARTDHAYREQGLRARLARYHGGNVDCAFRGWCDAWLAEEFRAWTIEAVVREVRVPVLCIRGNDDPYNSTIHVERIAELAAGPVRRVDLEQCGHAPHAEQPARVLSAIADFLHGL